MQDINQAYLILKDFEARNRYDREYLKFKAQLKTEPSKFDEQAYEDVSSSKKESKQEDYAYSNYDFDDKVLEKWMENAKKQARQMAKDALDEFKGAPQQAGKSIASYFLKVMIPMMLGYLILKACIN